MVKRLKFPKVNALVVQAEDAERRAEDIQWLIGDALLEECGAPPAANRADGSYEKIKECAAELEATGHPKFSVNYLARLREVSFTNPPAARIAGVSWSAHQEADDPKFLKAVVREAKKTGEKVTQDFVRAIRRTHYRSMETLSEEKGGFLKPVNRPRDYPNPDESRLGPLIAGSSLNELTRELKRQIEIAEREMNQINLDAVAPEFVDVSVRDLVGATQIIQTLTDTLRKRASKRGRAHLSTVA